MLNLDRISDSFRNLIMQHFESQTFQRHYLTRYISADTQAAYRGLPSQDALMRAASGMSRTIDPRRPRKLTTAQLAEIDQQPTVKELFRRREKLKNELRQAKEEDADMERIILLRTKHKEAQQAYRNEKRNQKDLLTRKIREQYKWQQPVIDIQ